MSVSRPKIFLIDFRKFGNHAEQGQHFRVEKMVGTIDYNAGSYLTDVQVKHLIDILKWNVTIRQPKDADF